jgi:hypothetical protein
MIILTTLSRKGRTIAGYGPKVRLHCDSWAGDSLPASVAQRPTGAVTCTPTQLVVANTGLGQSFSVPSGFPIALQLTVSDDCGNPITTAQVIAIFSNGDPPLLMTSLGNGSYSATWFPFNSSQRVTVSIRASATGLQAASVSAAGYSFVNPPFRLNQNDFVFTVPSNGGTQQQGLNIISQLAGTPLSWRVSTSSAGNWLSVDTSSGTTGSNLGDSSALNVIANTAGLAPGAYQGQILVIDTTGAFLTAVVDLLVLPPSFAGLPDISPGGLLFTATQGGSNPIAQNLSLRNLSSGSLAFNVSTSTSDGASWLAATPPSGATPSSASVTVNIGTLKAGVYTGKVSVVFAGAGGISQDAQILLVITAPSSIVAAAEPHGSTTTCVSASLNVLSTVLVNNFHASASWPIPISASVIDNCNTPASMLPFSRSSISAIPSCSPRSAMASIPAPGLRSPRKSRKSRCAPPRPG